MAVPIGISAMPRSSARAAYGDGSVFQRGNGYWVAAIRLPNGKKVTRTAKSEAAATKLLQDLRKQHILGTLATPTKVTLTEWYHQWLTEQTIRPSTLHVYRKSV